MTTNRLYFWADECIELAKKFVFWFSIWSHRKKSQTNFFWPNILELERDGGYITLWMVLKTFFFFGVIIFVCFQLRYSWWCTILYKFQVYNVVVDSFLSLCSICWRRKWQPTPVFLPEESHRQRSLEGYSPWGRKESDTTEQLSFSLCIKYKLQGCIVQYRE